MQSTNRKLSILVHLAKADKEFVDEERNFIYEIGKRNGFSQKDVDEIIEDPMGIPDLKNIPSDEKFDYMLAIIQLMKVDGKVRQSEIEFCEIMAMKLGYRAGVVAELSQHVYSDYKSMTNLNRLSVLTRKYLIDKS